jgi:hypothetical protein
MVPSSGAEPGSLRPERASREVGVRLPWRSLPPRACGLGAQAGRVRQQLPDCQPAHVPGLDVVPDRVRQAEAASVPQAEHGDGDERLGDRPGPVLSDRVGRLAIDEAASAGPDQLAVPHEAGHDRGQPLACLLMGQPHVKQAPGALVNH